MDSPLNSRRFADSFVKNRWQRAQDRKAQIVTAVDALNGRVIIIASGNDESN